MAARIAANTKVAFRLDGAFLEVIDDEFLDFFEAKVRQRPITLSTSRGQLRKFISVLAQRRPRRFLPAGANEPPRPALLLVTTEDTLIDQTVGWEAGKQGVALYQALAWEDDGLITVGPFRQLTGFADVAQSFQLGTTPQPLSL